MVLGRHPAQRATVRWADNPDRRGNNSPIQKQLWGQGLACMSTGRRGRGQTAEIPVHEESGRAARVDSAPNHGGGALSRALRDTEQGKVAKEGQSGLRTRPAGEDRLTAVCVGGAHRLPYDPGDGICRYPMRKTQDGTWRMFVPTNTGRWYRWATNVDIQREAGACPSRWRCVYYTRNVGCVLAEWGPTDLTIGAPKHAQTLVPSYWYEELYEGYDLRIGTVPPQITQSRRATEEALAERADASHACVFKSLHALARTRECRMWIEGMSWARYDCMGKPRGLKEEEIWSLCRQWAVYEQTTLSVFMAVQSRSDHNRGRNGSLRMVRQFCHTMKMDDRALILLAVRDGGDSVRGHALPFEGQMIMDYSVRDRSCYVWTDMDLADHSFVAEPRSVIEGLIANPQMQEEHPDDDETSDATSVVSESAVTAAEALNEAMSAAKQRRTHPDDIELEDLSALLLDYKGRSLRNAKLVDDAKKSPMPLALGRAGQDIFGMPYATGGLSVATGADLPVPEYDLVIDKPVFDGIQDPMIPGCKWRQGWWGPPPSEEYGCADYLGYELTFATVASATLEYVRENGKSVVYLPVEERPGFTIQGAYVTDLAGRRDRLLRAGDRVRSRWTEYVAVRKIACLGSHLKEVLVLKRCGSRGIGDVLGVPGFRVFWRTAEITDGPEAKQLEVKTLRGVEYKAMAMVTDDPIKNMAIHAVRAEQGKNDFPKDPKAVQKELTEFLTPYKKLNLENVAGPFKWGYCYGGCGSERPGKFHGRICPQCSVRNTDLGQFVADGHRICSVLNPVKYPGVVSTERKHFPLKTNAKTRAKLKTGTPADGDEARISVRDHYGRYLSWDDIFALPLHTKGGPRLGGVGIDGATPFVTAGGVRPLVEAIAYRVFKDLSVPDKAGNVRQVPDRAAYARAKALMPGLLPRLWWDRVYPTTIIDWINNMQCRRRRAALMRTLLQWKRDGYILPQDWRFIKAFVKGENLPSVGTSDEWWYSGEILPNGARYVARLIQAPHDVTHLIAGPYLRKLTSRLKEEWHSSNWLFYGSVPPEQLDHWLNTHRNAVSWFWSDYTAFDATYSPESWDLIETLYRRVFEGFEMGHFWDVIEAWRSPKGKMHLRKDNVTVEYEGDVCNCSGRDDTALANALLNGVVLAISFTAALYGCDVTAVQDWMLQGASSQVAITIVGDDSLAACYFDVRDYQAQIEQNIRRFGLIVKAESSQDLCDVTYLGMMPYPVKSGMLQWGPTIGRRLYKAYWQREPEGSLPAWTRGVAQQMALYKNVPILFELAEQVDDLLLTHKVTKQTTDRNRVWATRSGSTEPYDGRTIDWLCRRYRDVGLTPRMIQRDINIIRSITMLPAVVRLESVERIISKDDL